MLNISIVKDKLCISSNIVLSWNIGLLFILVIGNDFHNKLLPLA